jgi:hypothetical protein
MHYLHLDVLIALHSDTPDMSGLENKFKAELRALLPHVWRCQDAGAYAEVGLAATVVANVVTDLALAEVGPFPGYRLAPRRPSDGSRQRPPRTPHSKALLPDG